MDGYYMDGFGYGSASGSGCESSTSTSQNTYPYFFDIAEHNPYCIGDSQDDAGGVGELTEMFTAIFGMFGWLMTKLKSLGQWYKENYVGQFLKILLTYFQILGSFTMFTIEWPQVALDLIVYFKNIGKIADIFTLPNISCILAGYSDFDSTLKLYTLAPLVLIFMMSWPVLLAASPLRGYKSDGHYRWRHTLDRFWTNVMFVLFIIYPVVSITSMRAFNCDGNLGLLKDDYTMLCPPLLSFTCIYSAIFFVIYPIGIPVFMTTSMRVMGIAQIVKDKMERAQFSAMLSLFMKISCSVESLVCRSLDMFLVCLVAPSWDMLHTAATQRL